MGARRLFSRGDQIRGLVWGQKSPSEVQEWSPVGGLGAKPQKPTTGCGNNA